MGQGKQKINGPKTIFLKKGKKYQNIVDSNLDGFSYTGIFDIHKLRRVRKFNFFPSMCFSLSWGTKFFLWAF